MITIPDMQTKNTYFRPIVKKCITQNLSAFGGSKLRTNINEVYKNKEFNTATCKKKLQKITDSNTKLTSVTKLFSFPIYITLDTFSTNMVDCISRSLKITGLQSQDCKIQ